MEHQNPLNRYKTAMDYTYDDLSEQFQVSRSVIQRSIEGAYFSLPPRIVETLAYVEGKTVAQVNREYDLFVNKELAKVHLPPVALTKDTTLDDFDIWCSVLLRINGVNFVGNVPHLSVARILKMNTSVIASFYTGRTAHLPAQTIERVGLIKELQHGR